MRNPTNVKMNFKREKTDTKPTTTANKQTLSIERRKEKLNCIVLS